MPDIYAEGRDDLPNSHYTLTAAGTRNTAGSVFTLDSAAIAERDAQRAGRVKDVSNGRDQGPFVEVNGNPDETVNDIDSDGEPDATDFAPTDPDVQDDPTP